MSYGQDTADLLRENAELRQKLAESEKVPDKQPPDCCDPKAEVVECANCGVPVHTCELETPVGGDYRCPSHPDGVELGNGSWVCSEACGYEVDIESLRQKLVGAEEDKARLDATMQDIIDMIRLYSAFKWRQYKEGEDRGNERLEAMSCAADDIAEMIGAAIDQARGKAE